MRPATSGVGLPAIRTMSGRSQVLVAPSVQVPCDVTNLYVMRKVWMWMACQTMDVRCQNVLLFCVCFFVVWLVWCVFFFGIWGVFCWCFLWLSDHNFKWILCIKDVFLLQRSLQSTLLAASHGSSFSWPCGLIARQHQKREIESQIKKVELSTLQDCHPAKCRV